MHLPSFHAVLLISGVALPLLRWTIHPEWAPFGARAFGKRRDAVEYAAYADAAE
jgi:hypothetical protein